MEGIQLQDYFAFKGLAFEWADSIDKKDWNRLRNILAPKIMVDYSMIGKSCDPDMESEEFLSTMSSPDFVGDPLIHTQHLLGAVTYECVSENEVTAIHQVRAAHQRYSDPSLANVAYRGHGYGSVKHWYKKFGNNWKLAGVRPEMYWNEHDFSKIFPRQPSAS